MGTVVKSTYTSKCDKETVFHCYQVSPEAKAKRTSFLKMKDYRGETTVRHTGKIPWKENKQDP